LQQLFHEVNVMTEQLCTKVKIIYKTVQSMPYSQKVTGSCMSYIHDKNISLIKNFDKISGQNKLK